jgi:rhodanese-related sulfurtransferase
MTIDQNTNGARQQTGLDPQTVREWLDGERPPRLIDVRTPGEYTSAHIPGSYNVPLDLLREHRDEFGRHLDEDVVLICRSGARASQAETLIGEAPTSLPNLHVLSGGVAAWENAGAPLTRGAQTWELERQVRLVAGSIVLLSVVASIPFPWAKWIAAAIGAGLTFAALTNSCAMGMLLSKLPYNRQDAPSIENVLKQLSADGSRRAD